MAKVPTYDNSQVEARALPGTRQDTVGTPALFEGMASGADKFNTGLANAGDAFVAIQKEQKKENERLKLEADVLRVDDALNQVKEKALQYTFDRDVGYKAIKGNAALQRPDNKSLVDEYGDKLKGDVDNITKALGNDDQRRRFAMQSNDVLTNFRGQVQQHTLGEYNTFNDSVRVATMEQATQTIANFSGNTPEEAEARGKAVESATAAAAEYVKRRGGSASEVEVLAKKYISAGHKLALTNLVSANNPLAAKAYFEAYGKDMRAEDALAIKKDIATQVSTTNGSAVAQDVMTRNTPNIMPNDFDRLTYLRRQQESGNIRQDIPPSHWRGNAVITSPAGAVGISQVMPKTAEAIAVRATGKPLDKELFYRARSNDPVKNQEAEAYNIKLGDAVFAEEMVRYGHDYRKALAAYNGGPTETDRAIKLAAEADREARRPAGTSDWLPFHRYKETRDYVATIDGAFNSGAKPKAPTLDELVQTAVNNPRIANDPNARKVAEAAVKDRFKLMEDAKKQRDEEATVAAMQELRNNGGRYDMLPPAVKNAIPADKVDNVLTYGKRISAGEDITDRALYQKLETDDAYLKGLSNNEYFILGTQLSEADKKHFDAKRGKLLNPTGPDKAGDMNTEAIRTTLNNRLHSIGVDPSPKDKTDESQRVGAIRIFVNNSVANAQRISGKKMTDIEVAAHIDRLFTQSVELKGFFGNSYTTRLMQTTASDIPSDVKKALKEDFKKQGVSDPTDADLLGAYFRLNSTRRRTNTGSTGNF